MLTMSRTVVYFVDSPAFGGMEKALLLLLEGIDRKLWRPVLFYHDEPGLALFLEEIKKLNIRAVPVPRMRGAGVLSGFPIFLRRLQQERPSVFHAHLNWLLSCKYGLLAASLLRVPAVIATVQQYMVPPWGRTVYGQQQIVKSCVDQYIAVSTAVARQLSRTFGVQESQVRVVRNSISWDYFDRQAAPAAFQDEKRRPVILTVARLDSQKGHTFLLRAIRQLPEAVFVFAGSGPEKDSLEAEARALGVDGRVVMMGYREDIPELLACSDFVVLPSLYEGLPISVLEAMAAGKAVIATAAGGTPEAVVEGKTGFLVPPGDPEALACAISKLLKDPHLASEMGAAGKERVRREFSADSMVRSVTQTYTDVLERKGKGPEWMKR